MSAQTHRPRRSCLYMPGANTRALEKAKSLAADCVIFDLEDAVAPEAKLEARAAVTEAVKAGGYGSREVVIRINGLDTEWGLDDLKAAVAAGPDAVPAPKSIDGGDIFRTGERRVGGEGWYPWGPVHLKKKIIGKNRIYACT